MSTRISPSSSAQKYGEAVEAVASYTFEILFQPVHSKLMTVNGREERVIFAGGMSIIEEITGLLCSVELMDAYTDESTGKYAPAYFFIVSPGKFVETAIQNIDHGWRIDKILKAMVNIVDWHHHMPGVITVEGKRGYEKIFNCLKDLGFLSIDESSYHRWTVMGYFYVMILPLDYMRGNFMDYSGFMFPPYLQDLKDASIDRERDYSHNPDDIEFQRSAISSWEMIYDDAPSFLETVCNAVSAGRFDCAIDLIRRRSINMPIEEAVDLLHCFVNYGSYEFPPYEDRIFENMKRQILGFKSATLRNCT